jgi:hypothetical protein
MGVPSYAGERRHVQLMAAPATGASLGRVSTRLAKPVRGAVLKPVACVL